MLQAFSLKMTYHPVAARHPSFQKEGNFPTHNF
jgi:hypothetical protein